MPKGIVFQTWGGVRESMQIPIKIRMEYIEKQQLESIISGEWEIISKIVRKYKI